MRVFAMSRSDSGSNFSLSHRHALIKRISLRMQPQEFASPVFQNQDRATSPEGGLDFQLTEEQLHLKKSVREFAEREIAPNVMKWDEAGEFPLSTIKELGKLGLLGTIFPSEYSGAGMGYVDYVTAIEEL